MLMRKLLLAGTMLMVFAHGPEALAWGCVAVSSDGERGESSNWPSEQDAQANAISDCDVRSSTDDCAVESCDPQQ
jgi:hypothetical protein